MSGSSPQGAPSASMLASAGQAQAQDITFGYYPSEGSRCLTTMYSWASSTFYQEDFSQYVARGELTTFQGVFVDNSTNTDSVVITINGTMQVIACPAFSQGVFPTFFTGTPACLIQSGTPTGETSSSVTRCCWLNAPPQAAGIWAAPSVPGLLPTPAGFPVDGGKLSTLDLAVTPSTLIKAGAGRVATLVVITQTTTAAPLLCDAASIGAANVTNCIFPVANALVSGTIAPLNFPFFNGLVMLANGAAAGNVSISYT
jgi:hypothetical protein